MLAVNLTLRSGDGAPPPLQHMRQVMFGVTGPDGAIRPLQGQTAPQLTRFLSDSLLQEAHRGLFPNRAPNEIPDLSEVELEITSHWGDNRVPVFDITFRATLPEGSVVTDDQGPPPKGVNLALTLHVSRDELGSPLPNFTVDGPHIELRKQQ